MAKSNALSTKTSKKGHKFKVVVFVSDSKMRLAYRNRNPKNGAWYSSDFGKAQLHLLQASEAYDPLPCAIVDIETGEFIGKALVARPVEIYFSRKAT